jgi:RNA polymerase sigma factor (sigma-70 family)
MHRLPLARLHHTTSLMVCQPMRTLATLTGMPGSIDEAVTIAVNSIPVSLIRPAQTTMLDLDRFLEHDYERVVRTVALACGDAGRAQDAVQHALATALDTQRRGRAIEHLVPWVITVAINSNRRHFRRQAVEARSYARLAPLQRDQHDAEDAAFADLHAAIVLLPLRQRQAIVLYYLHDLDVTTIGIVLGVRPGTVKTALSRGREALAVALRSGDDDHDERRPADG